MRLRYGAGIDGESLQADVMRFMAIIAFCLLAILALVRNVEAPAAASVEETAPAPVKETAATPEKVATIAEEPTKEIFATPPLREQPPPSLPSLPKLPSPPTVAAQPAPEPEPAAVSPEPEVAESTAAPEGLSLRFASDADFLRLLKNRDVELYLFQDSAKETAEVFTLGRDYVFVQTPAPAQVYELMPQTIPNSITRLAEMKIPNLAAYTWGVRMPPRIESKIRHFVATLRSGGLLIDRFGGVRHVEG